MLLEQNTLVVNTGDKLVLFDTGTGFAKVMGPHSGKLLANLKAAGIDPRTSTRSRSPMRIPTIAGA